MPQNPQPLVLAIEPDLRQAAIVKRIVREKVLADVAVVDSRDAAMEAMRTTIPDVLLLSALMSPRDEDELIAHLRTLEHADHLQTHTIPQLASTLNPIESRGSRGLLSAFRRKKDPEAAPSGCDPDLFAEEIRVFLQRAADKKRERSAAPAGAPPADTAWRAAYSQKSAAPVVSPDAAPVPDAAASSAWSSPFEWKPSTASTPMIDPDAITSRRESAVESSAPPPVIPEPAAAAHESLMAHLRPRTGIPTVADLATQAETADSPAPPLATVIPDPASVIVAEPIPLAAPVVVAAPVMVAAPIAVATPIQVAESRTEERGARRDDGGARIEAPAVRSEARAARHRDSGLGIREQRAAMRDRKLGALASWARSDDRGRETAPNSDDLRGLLTGLAVPSAVVSVGYGRGCRIRRVRVPAARESQETEAVGAVILSKRLLAEQREQPQV